MKRKVIIGSIVLVIIIFIIDMILKFIKMPGIGDYYIVEFNESNSIQEEDYNQICEILSEYYNIDNIKINKIACKFNFRNEGAYYIFFRGGSSNEKTLASGFKRHEVYDENGKYVEDVFEDLCLSISFDETYKKVDKICRKYYKWWKSDEKKVEKTWEK